MKNKKNYNARYRKQTTAGVSLESPHAEVAVGTLNKGWRELSFKNGLFVSVFVKTWGFSLALLCWRNREFWAVLRIQ